MAALHIKNSKYQENGDISQPDNVLLSNITFFPDICCFWWAKEIPLGVPMTIFYI